MCDRRKDEVKEVVGEVVRVVLAFTFTSEFGRDRSSWHHHQ